MVNSAMSLRWYKFKALNIMGMFACELDKNGSFKKMHWCKYLLIFSTWLTIIFSLSIGSSFFVAYKSNIGIITFFQEAFQLMIDSTTTSISMGVIVLLTNIKCFTLAYSNFQLSRQWPEFWSQLSQFDGRHEKFGEKVQRKSSKWLKR